MIYIFDKKQVIIKVLTNDDFTAAHLNFKINTATTFEFSLPASKALPSGSKYVATPHPLDNSKFIMLRLTERVDNTETIDYSAYELAYQELATDGYIEDKRPAESDAKTLMQIALNGTNWELNNVNVAGTAKTNFYYTDHLSAISNVVDLLGGEIVFYIEIQGNAISGRYMDYLARQGADTSKVFASGSNLLTVERQSDTSNIYTAILPRGKGEEIDNGDADTPDGYGRRINIADVEWKKSSGSPLDKPKGSMVLSDPDATAEWGQINGNARLLLQTYDDIDDVNVLINSAYKTLQSVNHPQIQYSATVADVGGLSLGDTVLIMHGDRDLSYKTRVFEVKYDLLSPDQTELSLGDDLSSNSITSQINNLNAVADTTSSQTQWTINQIGRPGTTYGETAPDSPKVGDIWFKYLPDGGTEIYRWNGDIWELLASPTTADDIADAVDEAVAQANAHTDEVKQGLSTDIATAKSQAASQANAAETNAKSAATSQFTQAQSALSATKTDLTNSIASEASARNAAVAAADSQAQTYANQAKADAMSAASSADGVIRTAISSSADSLSATITQNKATASSGISTAQTTAQQAVDGLKTKVSQTDYNAKTGQLQTDLTATTQTANQAKTDIVSIKQKDSDQDAKMNSIVSDANGTKQTVSDLQTTQGKQSGDISTLQQRADGFDATVTKLSTNVNSLNQINNVINSEFSPDLAGWYVRGDPSHASVIDSGSFGYNTSGYAVIDSTGKTGSNFYFTSAPYPVNAGGVPFSETLRIRTNVSNATVGIGVVYYDVNKAIVSAYRTTVSATGDWSLFSYSGTLPSTAYYISFDVMIPSSTLARFVISQPMIVTSTTIGDYVSGSYNNNDALAKVKISADKATLDLSTYKTDADGRISKAQTDITATAKQVATKVSQTDYDTKTGQLTTSVSKAQQTADAATTSLANYKTDADGRISANSADIVINANAIKQKVAQSDYDANNTKLNSRLTTVETTANGTATTVSNLQQTVNNLGQVNQLFNTEFSPDFSGWFIRGYYGQDISKGGWVKGYPVNGHGSISHVKQPYAGNLQSPLINATGANKISISAVVSVYSDDGVGNSYITLDAFNQDGTFVSQITAVFIQNGASDKYIKLENITIPSNVSYVSLGMLSPSATVTYKLSQTMLVFSSTVGAYVQGNYNNNAALAQVKITADSISNFVRDSSGNISSDFQTALSKTSIITGSTLATSIQTQTATQITSALTDNNGKIISLINQDNSGVQIAGKNIVLNGDTTVTGSFKVSQANIANGAIGTAQIGDAAITSAKIANLDVSKITGDVTNFIKSNWNGEYGSVSIDSWGMTVSTSEINTEFDDSGMTLNKLGEEVGGIGVIGWNGMNDNFQGLAISLNGVGDFITLGARDNGIQTGVYYSKLAWFRGGTEEGVTRPSGTIAGFTVYDAIDLRKVQPYGAFQSLKFVSNNFNGVNYPSLLSDNGNVGIAFGGTELYLIRNNTYYPLNDIIRVTQWLLTNKNYIFVNGINGSGQITSYKWSAW